MNVTGPHKDRVEDWMSQKEIVGCLACGSSNFMTQEVCALVVTGSRPSPTPGPGPAVPLLPVICMECGYTMTFHAGKLGLI